VPGVGTARQQGMGDDRIAAPPPAGRSYPVIAATAMSMNLP
jgi:hypothetical protein